ncbi:MAG: glycosyltransferase family 4 protein, partial [Pseudomonadota bacterium]
FGGETGIATVGRIRPEKGTDRFVDAMNAALPGLPGVVALVVGRATPEHRRFETDLHARVAEAGLTDRIKFTGERPPDDLPALMRGISLLVALPRYEGYGMTPLEAMASGTPFVAMDAGYYRAFSQEGRCGTVLECDAPQTAADAVAALLSDPARLSVMAHAARQAAQDQHSIDTEAAGAAAVYDALWQRG